MRGVQLISATPVRRVAPAFAIFLFSALLAAPSVAQGPAPSAAPVLRSWLDALERGDADAAWELLTPDARAGHTLPTFREAVAAGREELIRKARAWLAAADGAPVRAVVTVGRLELTLAQEPDGWRLARWPEAAGGSARDTAAAAARLARAHLLDGLRRLALAPAARAELERRLDAAATALDAIAAGEEPEGDAVEATLPDGSVVRLIRTDGGWWMADLRWLTAP